MPKILRLVIKYNVDGCGCKDQKKKRKNEIHRNPDI